jgi:hypothetical protein
VLRLATPQLKNMSRFDCIFYIVDNSVQKINLGDSDSLEHLNIGMTESTNYFWKEPS